VAAPDLIVAGAGMAGLAAAAQATSRGARVLLLEKEPQVGGSMLLSSGVAWRYREWAEFRRQCPTGSAPLQRLVFDRLDGDLRWLESLGVSIIERDTGNRLTVGVRLDTASVARTLAAGIAEIRCHEPLAELPSRTPVVLATGGFQAGHALVEQHVTAQAASLLLRAAPGSTGDGLRLGLQAGGTTSAGIDEFYGRNMPAPPAHPEPAAFVPLAQTYARYATVANQHGERFVTATWAETDVVQWTARQPGARAWYTVEDSALDARVRERTVGEIIAAARAAGAPVTHRDARTTVEVVAAITTTNGGLRITEDAQAAPGVFAAGADVGGISTGGYSSGLAAALVFGRIAADAALGLGRDPD
jgi:succinate dehydrogenase/fumarate reductase flavoprotein subunit